MLNDRPLWVTIPTIGYSGHLIPLLQHLERDKEIDKILLTVNLAEYVEVIEDFFHICEPKIEVIDTSEQGVSLHHGWNTAIERAREANAWLAVLNDDIELMTPNAISHAARLLDDDPTYAIVGLDWHDPAGSSFPPIRQTHGTYRHGGIGGWAWVCDPHKVTLVPDDFVWWYGDDHIVFSAERDGHKVGIAAHIHVKHVNELTAASQEWTHEAKAQDAEAFRRIWPNK
jgi:hypothetical protein